MDDKTLGYTIIVITLTVMVGYFIWLFPGLFEPLFCSISAYSEWAIKIPVILAVYTILFIVTWIGYTMATTPPLAPFDAPIDSEVIDEE